MRKSIITVTAAASCALFASGALAGVGKSFVSGAGNDSNAAGGC